MNSLGSEFDTINPIIGGVDRGRTSIAETPAHVSGRIAPPRLQAAELHQDALLDPAGETEGRGGGHRSMVTMVECYRERQTPTSRVARSVSHVVSTRAGGGDRMASDEYALANAWELADRRLDALELAHDAATQRRLRAAGSQPGWRCLEVGAGRGSIARWLGSAVGPRGQVIALDIDARFLRDVDPQTIEVVEANVVTDPLPPGPFDLVHARLLLMHLAARDQLVPRLVDVLAPGGVLLLEEHDTFPVTATAEGHTAQRGRCSCGRWKRPVWRRHGSAACRRRSKSSASPMSPPMSTCHSSRRGHRRRISFA
jgi:SAM-dependent methyltransferase